MGQAAKRVNGHMSTFGRRLKDILASAFIFNILSAGLRQFTTWAGKSVKTNDQARQAIARLKGALLTLAQPLIEVVIPAFYVSCEHPGPSGDCGCSTGIGYIWENLEAVQGRC